MITRQLQPWIPTWEDLRDQEVRKVDLESAIELRHLAETQQLKQARREHSGFGPHLLEHRHPLAFEHVEFIRR